MADDPKAGSKVDPDHQVPTTVESIKKSGPTQRTPDGSKTSNSKDDHR